MDAQSANRQHPREKKHQQLTPEQIANLRAQLLKAKLNLSDDQTVKTNKALLQFEQQRSDSKEEMRMDRETLESSLNSIFTPEQQTQFKEMQEQRKEQMKDRNQNSNTPTPIEQEK